jgi:micrococcal nuclease
LQALSVMIGPAYQYEAHCDRVIDGDTLQVTVSLGFMLTMDMRLRLARINTPEMHSKDPEVRERAKEAQAFVVHRVLDKDIVIQTRKADAFGRYLAEVWCVVEGEQRNLNDDLLAAGLAVLYTR